MFSKWVRFNAFHQPAAPPARPRSKTEAAEPASLQDRSRGAGLAPRPKPRSRPRFLCHDLTGAIGQIILAKTYVNMFEGPVTGNIPEVLDNGEVTDGTHVTAGQLALDLAVNTAASGNNAAAIQSLDDRVTAELASKLDSSALAPAILRGHHALQHVEGRLVCLVGETRGQRALQRCDAASATCPSVVARAAAVA